MVFIVVSSDRMYGVWSMMMMMIDVDVDDVDVMWWCDDVRDDDDGRCWCMYGVWV